MEINNRILRKFGFKKDQNGIINRYLREKDAWETHLSNTKKFITDFTENRAKDSCVILGSGWLLDVPIENLSKLFDKVYLIDIVHPRQIIHKYRKNENIKFIQADISGYIMPVYTLLKKSSKVKIPVNNIEQQFPESFKEKINNASMIVSVNILNQLDILICDYIKKFNIYSDEEMNVFRKIIQQKHIDLLPRNKSCIITDYEELNYNNNMQLVKSKPLVYLEQPKSKNVKKWKWDFDLNKTYHKNYKTVFKVMAWEI